MLQNYRLKRSLNNSSKESNFKNFIYKKGDLHWDYIIGLIIIGFLIIFGIWFAYKSGKFTLEIWPQF